MMKMFILPVMVLLVSVWSGSGALAEQVNGGARAMSGDTLQIGTEQFFLNGITAPKDDGASTKRLQTLLSNGEARCEVQEISQGSHRTALCSAGDVDLSDAMVRSGLVFGWRENGVDLAERLDEVRRSGIGIWGDEEMGRIADEISKGSRPPRDCVIKGNRSRQAPYDLKYHMPEFAYYSRTRINLQEKEQWFCFEAQARDAGFVRAAR